MKSLRQGFWGKTPNVPPPRSGRKTAGRRGAEGDNYGRVKAA